MFRKLFFMIFFIVSCWPRMGSAQDLHFAGFSLVGEYKYSKDRYPVAYELMSEKTADGRSVLDVALQKELKTLKRNDLNIVSTLGEQGNGNELALAFALSEESVEEVAWGNGYLSVYRVVGQILAFDFEEKKVIANFSAMSQFQDFTDTKKTQEMHNQVFEKIYLDNNFANMIFKEWVRRLETAPIRPKYRGYLKLGDVRLADMPASDFPKGRTLEDIKTQIAQSFESYFSAAHNVPLVPYLAGQSVSKNMAARFSNGMTFQLELPEPDYVFNLLVRPFKTAKFVKESSHSEQYAFGAFMTLEVEQPDLGKKYLSSRFKNIEKVSFAIDSHTVVDLPMAYQNSLKALFAKFSNFTASEDEGGLESMTKNQDIMDQVKSLKEIVKKCS